MSITSKQRRDQRRRAFRSRKRINSAKRYFKNRMTDGHELTPHDLKLCRRNVNIIENIAKARKASP